MLTCYIHAGTHKTGTTTLQTLTRRHRVAIAAAGFYYPSTGAPPDSPDGHHNLAWEMTRDDRYRIEHGTIDDMVREISGVQSNVILSSEDFTGCVYQHDEFARFLARIRGAGFAPRFIVYLRNQVDYCQSLYLELLKFGLTDSFDEFVESILETGTYRWRQWVFPFCYDNFLARLVDAGGTTCCVRSYEVPHGGSLAADWLSMFALSPEQCGADVRTRANERTDACSAMRYYYENQAGRVMDPVEQRVLQAMLSSSLTVSSTTRLRIVERFRESNRAVVARHPHLQTGLVDLPHAQTQGADDHALPMEAIFSPAMSQTLAHLAQVARTDGDRLAPDSKDPARGPC